MIREAKKGKIVIIIKILIESGSKCINNNMKLIPTSSSSSLGLYKPASYTVLFLWSDSTARIQRKCKRQKKFISEIGGELPPHLISRRICIHKSLFKRIWRIKYYLNGHPEFAGIYAWLHPIQKGFSSTYLDAVSAYKRNPLITPIHLTQHNDSTFNIVPYLKPPIWFLGKTWEERLKETAYRCKPSVDIYQSFPKSQTESKEIKKESGKKW